MRPHLLKHGAIPWVDEMLANLPQQEPNEDFMDYLTRLNKCGRELLQTLESELTAVTEQRDEAREALSNIAFYLSVGMGDESTTAQVYHDRIIQGITMLTDPIMDCWEQTKLKLAESEAYADKLAAGLPTGMLPKDVENLREANTILANNLHKAEQKLAKLKRYDQSSIH